MQVPFFDFFFCCIYIHCFRGGCMQIPYQIVRMKEKQYAVMPYVSQVDYPYLAKELCSQGCRRVLAVFGYYCLSFSKNGMDVFLGQDELTCVANFLYQQHQKKEFDITTPMNVTHVQVIKEEPFECLIQKNTHQSMHESVVMRGLANVK